MSDTTETDGQIPVAAVMELRTVLDGQPPYDPDGFASADEWFEHELAGVIVRATAETELSAAEMAAVFELFAERVFDATGGSDA